MKISVHDNRKISDIKNEFQEIFPYLKIEFFRYPNYAGKDTTRRQLLDDRHTISEYSSDTSGGDFFITPETTVSSLEASFRDAYGLTVLIFRRSGSVWLETGLTNEWKLSEQNMEAETLDREVLKSKKK